jgi:hypothetical protein
MVGSSDHRAQAGITACSRNESTEKIMARRQSLEGAAGYRGERRAIERRWLYRSALLSIPGQIVAQSCSLRDFTIQGAGVRLRGITLLPLNFELSFDGFRSVEPCRLIWRDGDFAGLIFLALVSYDRVNRSG